MCCAEILAKTTKNISSNPSSVTPQNGQHTFKTIRLQQPSNWLGVFDHFVELVLKITPPVFESPSLTKHLNKTFKYIVHCIYVFR